MGRKHKYSKENKIQACEDYLSGKSSASEKALKLKMTKSYLCHFLYGKIESETKTIKEQNVITKTSYISYNHLKQFNDWSINRLSNCGIVVTK